MKSLNIKNLGIICRNVDIHFGSHKVQFVAEASGEKVMYDGSELTIPANQDRMEVTKVGHYTIFTHATLGFKVSHLVLVFNTMPSFVQCATLNIDEY